MVPEKKNFALAMELHHPQCKKYFPSPVTVIPLRYAHEDTQLGGYDILARTSEGSKQCRAFTNLLVDFVVLHGLSHEACIFLQLAINLYTCNMNKKDWDEPEEWKPERFLGSNFEPMDLYKTMAFGPGKRVCAGSLQAVAPESPGLKSADEDDGARPPRYLGRGRTMLELRPITYNKSSLECSLVKTLRRSS